MSVRTIQLILEARDQGATAALQNVRGGVQGVGGDLRQMQSFALRAGSALGIAFGAREVVGFLLQTNRETERLKAQLRTFDGERAGAVFRDIERFASKTPFQIEEITEAYIRLRSLGLDPTEETMTAFGDTAAAMGKSFVQWAEAVGDATTFEFERLKEFGIKASTQGQIVKLSFRGQSIEVRKDAGAIADALERIGRSEFAGAMNQQMNTINGAISNLQDNLGTLARTIGEAGLNEFILSVAGSVRDWTGQIADNKDEIRRWVRITIEGVGFAAEAFLLIPRVATDSMQAVSSAAVLASELLKRKVNFDVEVIDSALGGLERLMPRTMARIAEAFGKEDLRLDKPFDTTDLSAVFEASMSGVKEEIAQTIERLKGLSDAWWDVAIAASESGAAQEAAGAGFGGGGGGGSASGSSGRGSRGSGALGLTNTAAAVQAVFRTRPRPPAFTEPLFEQQQGPFAGGAAAVLGFNALDPLLSAREGVFSAVAETSTWMAESYARDLEMMRQSSEAFAATVTDSLGVGVVDVFATMGSALAGSFGSIEGGLKAVGGSVASTLGDMMINAGTMIVTTSNAFRVFRESLTSLAPSGGIAAGLALIAAGAAMKSAVGSFLSNPTGGGGGGGVGGGSLSLRDFNDIAQSRGNQGRVEIHFPSGPGLYDPNDYRQREAFKRMFRQLTGSRELVFVEG